VSGGKGYKEEIDCKGACGNFGGIEIAYTNMEILT
jgi:hypothetical protein